MKTLDSKKKSRFERVEPGLFRYKPSGSYYTVLKKDGKTKWRNLQTTDKATARRMLADERDADAELDSNLSGLESAMWVNDVQVYLWQDYRTIIRPSPSPVPLSRPI
jgi:hypothetical protein